MTTKVKICGIKTLGEAQKAVEFGADAIGMLVQHPNDPYYSPFLISLDEANAIVQGLPPFVSTVLVTHLDSLTDIVELLKKSKTSTVVLHGNNSTDEVKQIKELFPYLKLYRTVYVLDESAIEEAKKWIDIVDAILLDSANPETGQFGGTGKPHDWNISAEIVKQSNKPVILAGGLNSENVQEAIRIVHPYAVDINSGVNTGGKKDYDKLEKFIKNAKLAS